VTRYRVIGERRYNAKGRLVNVTEATVKIAVGAEEGITIAEGNGPVNALDKALRNGLVARYKSLAGIRLTDFKVRILDTTAGTMAVTRVVIESRDSKGNVWRTLGVSTNLIDAAFDALIDALTYRLLKDTKK
jgi:2-isopropylmalate synthase